MTEVLSCKIIISQSAFFELCDLFIPTKVIPYLRMDTNIRRGKPNQFTFVSSYYYRWHLLSLNHNSIFRHLDILNLKITFSLSHETVAEDKCDFFLSNEHFVGEFQ